MAPRRDWCERRVTAAAALLMIAVLTGASLQSLKLGPSQAGGPSVFTISIEHFGLDPQMMERRITIPLEDAVSNLPGIGGLRSVSEYGRSSVEVALSPSTDPDRFYLSLRDAVNTLSASLPSAAQRPEILGTASGARPFFIAAVRLEGAALERTREYVDANLKPTIERVEGVGKVEVGGGSAREIHLDVSQERAAAAVISLPEIASALQRSSLLRPIGRLRSRDSDTPIIIEGRLASLQELASLPIPLRNDRVVRLGALAQVGYGKREPETTSRIDGERRIAIYVTASGSANLVALSAAIRQRLAGFAPQGLSVEIISDLGGEIARAISEVLRSLAVSAGAVSLFVALALRPFRNAALLALLLPSVVLLSAAILAAFSVAVDRNVLAGIAVGIGLVIDPGIVLLCTLSAAPPDCSHAGRRASVAAIASPLAASTATTLIVLLPLFFFGRSITGLTEVASSLAVMLPTSLALSLLFLPVFASGARRSPPDDRRRPRTGALRTSLRALDALVAWAGSHSRRVVAAGAAICVAGLLAATRMEVRLTEPSEKRSVYAHLEFASGTSLEAIDRRTTDLAREVLLLKGVEHVTTIARRESAGLTVALDGSPGAQKRVRRALASGGARLRDAFVYLPEGAQGEDQSIEVSLLGPEDPTLRSTAARVAGELHREEWISQVVLNFKEGPPAYLFAVDHRALAERQVSAREVAEALRWGIYGPVALKWIEPGSPELDLRLGGGFAEPRGLSTIERIGILDPEGRSIPLSQLGQFVSARPAARLYRAERQRAVSFTVHATARGGAEHLAKLESLLRSTALPPGCAFRIDRQVYDRLSELHRLELLLAAAIALIFITLAAQMESLSSPLLVMSIVPASLSVPIAVLRLSGACLDVPVLVSLIIMAGISVNNSILILDRALARCERLQSYTRGEVERSVRYAVRSRTRALLLTSGTALLGVLPFLFGGPSEAALFRPLAIVVFCGTLASTGATFLVVPAAAAIAPVFARRFPTIRR